MSSREVRDPDWSCFWCSMWDQRTPRAYQTSVSCSLISIHNGATHSDLQSLVEMVKFWKVALNAGPVNGFLNKNAIELTWQIVSQLVASGPLLRMSGPSSAGVTLIGFGHTQQLLWWTAGAWSSTGRGLVFCSGNDPSDEACWIRLLLFHVLNKIHQ